MINLGHFINRSHIHSDYEESAETKKRRAYDFFDQEKKKIVSKKKTSDYLLPKICISSKKNYQSTITRCSQHKSKESRNNLEEKQNKKSLKIKKERSSKLERIYKGLQVEADIEEVKKQFRAKCEEQLSKIQFRIPEQMRKKCFFDLDSDQIEQLYSKEDNVTSEQKQQNESDKQNRGKKFRLIQRETIEENKSVPMFLMQRLSLKDLSNLNSSSFMTEALRICASKPKKKDFYLPTKTQNQ